MSFGGAVAAMITSLKNNSRRHKGKSAFDGRGEKLNGFTPLRFKNENALNEEQLKRLAQKVKRHQRIRFIKAFLLSIVLFVLLLIFAHYAWYNLNFWEVMNFELF